MDTDDRHPAPTGSVDDANLRHLDRREAKDEVLKLRLAQGDTQSQAASAAGVSERTVRRRWATDQGFRDDVAILREGLFNEAAAKIVNLTAIAASTLEELTGPDTDPKVRLQAATTILSTGLKLQDIERLRRRIEALETETAERSDPR